MSEKGSLKNIKTIFERKIFRIPDYQRGYSWKIDQVKALWDDLNHIISSNGENISHYTGMITVQRPTKEDIINKWSRENKNVTYQFYVPREHGLLELFYIVDGQQRLTTIMLLLAAIRDSNKLENSLEIESNFICKTIENEKVYLLSYEIETPSQKFLINKLLSNPSIDCNDSETAYTRNLENAKKYFDEKITKLNKDEIAVLYQKTTENLLFNWLETPKFIDVFTIFETMNYRGLELSTLELLKNRLIYLSSLLPECDTFKRNELRNHINYSLNIVYEGLAKNKNNFIRDDEFLRIHWLMYFNHDDDNITDLRHFKQYLLDIYFVKDNIINGEITYNVIYDYVSSLQESVLKFFELKNPKHSLSTLNEPIKQWLFRINKFRTYFDALLLATFVKKIDDVLLIELLKNIERYCFFIFYLADYRANKNKIFFLKEANKIFRGDESVTDIIELIKPERKASQLAKTVDDINSLIIKFKKNIDKLFADEGFLSWKGIKYFLFEYEESLRKENEPKIFWEKSQIEKIFPNTLELQRQRNSKTNEFNNKVKVLWKEFFVSGIADDRRKNLCFSLGNLVITQYRKSKLEEENSSFIDKKKYLMRGSYSENELCEYENWTPIEILDRGLKMFKFMEDRWGLNLADEKKQILHLNWKITSENSDEIIAENILFENEYA